MSPHRMLWLWSAVLFVVVALLYLPTLRGGFVYDSIAQVLYSDYIHAPANWVDVLTLRVVGQDELDRNRPLHLASLMLDAAVWKKEPFGYRLTSVLLHALNAALLFVFATMALRWRTNGRDERLARPSTIARARGPHAPTIIFVAAFGSLVFALHPLVVEAVAESSNREDLLVLLPMLVGLIGILRPIRSPWSLNALFIVCSFLAVLAKESGIAVPFIFGVACWLLGSLRRHLPGLIGALFAVGVFLAASYAFRPEASGIFAYSPAPLAEDAWTMLAVQARIWTLQLWQIVWPWNLSAHYPPASIGGIAEPLAFGVLVMALIAVLFLWRFSRLAMLGVAIYVLALLPASNLLPQYHPIADRYLYVPLAGLGMIAAALVHRLCVRYPSGFAGAAIIAGLLVLICLEYAANLRRQFVWQQPATLWSDVLRQYPNMSQAQIGMANVHYRAGDFQAARAAATEAVVSSGGGWADAWALRAICEWQTGAPEQAVGSLRQARRLSRVYNDGTSAPQAMILSPEQLSVLFELMGEAGN